MTGNQDDQSGPLTRHLRAAMVAIDKIADSEMSIYDRSSALYRVQQYALTKRTGLWDEDSGADLQREVASEDGS